MTQSDDCATFVPEQRIPHDRLAGLVADWLVPAADEAEHASRVKPAVILLRELLEAATVHSGADSGDCGVCAFNGEEREIIKALSTVLNDRIRHGLALVDHAARCTDGALADVAEQIDHLADDLQRWMGAEAPQAVVRTYRACSALVRQNMTAPKTHTPEPGRVPTAPPTKEITAMTIDTDTDFSQTSSPIGEPAPAAQEAPAQPDVEETPAQAPEAVENAATPAEDVEETEGDHGPVTVPAEEDQDGAQ